jgi:hypothetical protein
VVGTYEKILAERIKRTGELYEQQVCEQGWRASSFGPASRFVGLALAVSHPSHYLSVPKREGCTAFREPL